jgi:ribonuclease HII
LAIYFASNPFRQCFFTLASILAKVTRDRAIAKLRKDYDLGSGYPSDSLTVKFVTKYYKKNHEMPNFVRKSWKPDQTQLGFS